MNGILMRVMFTSMMIGQLASGVSAADLFVTYITTPAGATLIQHDGGITSTWGPTPFTLKYKVNEWKGCVLLRPITTQWMSGAEKTITPRVCSDIGKRQQVMILRPTHAGLEADVLMASQLTLEAGTATLQQERAPQIVPYVPRPLPCTYTRIGNIWSPLCP